MTAPSSRRVNQFTGERWVHVTVPGFEDFHEVSDLGRVRSLDRMIPVPNGTGTKTHRGRILKPCPGTKNYRMVTLRGNGHQKTMPVHRLVMLAFVGPRPDGMQTRHINGDKGDNRLVNLVYGTPLENAQDARTHGTYVSANARKTHCKRGHQLTEQNVRIYQVRNVHVSLVDDNGKSKSRRVHQLVLEAFVGPRPHPDAVGLHYDDDIWNNHVDNLRWGSRSDNWRDAQRNGRAPVGSTEFLAENRPWAAVKRGTCKRGHPRTAENIPELAEIVLPKLHEYVPRRTLYDWHRKGKLEPRGYRGLDGAAEFLLADVRKLRSERKQAGA